MAECGLCHQEGADELELTIRVNGAQKTIDICESCAKQLVRDVGPTADEVVIGLGGDDDAD